MIFTNENELKDRVRELTGRAMTGTPQILEDTTQYMAINGGMILRLGGNDYYVTGEANEGRFGIEEQPKFWVKYAVDLETGRRKIIKLVFYEEFTSRVGPFLIRGKRSPEKEKRVLEFVKGHPGFMQGIPFNDPAGNLVRIIDFVPGANLFRYLYNLDVNHEYYYHNILPGIMKKLIKAYEALDLLIQNGMHHGDVRADHIIIESDTNNFVWIDFDFEVSHIDFDIWSMGDVLVFAVGKGDHSFQDVFQCPDLYPVDVNKVNLCPDDGLLFFRNQIANLRKIFPYIPEKLNRIMTSFGAGTYFFYESAGALIDDIREIFPS